MSPAPYYSDDHCTIYHGDCREVLAWDVAGGVLVTDPPYGMAFESGWSGKSVAGDDDTSVRDFVLARWAPRPALVFGRWNVERPEGTRHVLVWDKGDWPGMGDLSLPWGPSSEEIYVLGSGFVGRRGASVIRVAERPSGPRARHHNEKPVSLMVALVERCAPLAEVVDPFMGSGTTLRAAKDLGRKAIGIEIEERYCEIAAKRLAQEVLPLGEAS